ncbi:methyltransferase family protein [Luteimonas cucumeris]|uniref:Methyltransferase family protein n=1 Tax=Luteimonas cucumeris TaxID=985012 RepID=A0A562L5I5_9GAMM|nr:class I SAM-dependent methyltransferase [Luteimonas cucumeris]TWI02883.1 methyltransferase family protein [Luteimonas cucumeris]
MTRIPTAPGAKGPRIDRDAVLSFFEQRAGKVGELGPLRAVIYQDKHPDLAERRDAAEKTLIRPLLELSGTQRLIDIGCGTGRWVDEIAADCGFYLGIDASPSLIAHARRLHVSRENCAFSVASADELTLDILGQQQPFDRILCAGIAIYLNDDELDRMLAGFAHIGAASARILMREPMGIGERLTIRDHYSDDLEQTYNAIYRTEGEVIDAMSPLFAQGFAVTGSGDVYADASLNNRPETRQRWLTLERFA